LKRGTLWKTVRGYICICVTGVALLFSGCRLWRMGTVTKEHPALWHYRQGRQFLDLHCSDKAAEEFRASLAIDSTYAPAYEGLSLVSLTHGDTVTSRWHVEKALALNPDLSSAHVALGRLYDAQGQYTRALAEQKRAVELDPTNADAFFFSGATNLKMGRFDAAEDDLKEALRIRPHDVWTRDALAHVQRTRRAMPNEYVSLVVRSVATRGDLGAVAAAEVYPLIVPLQAWDEGDLPPDPLAVWKGESLVEREPDTDIHNHWAEELIRQALDLRLLWVYPNGRFEPEERITRGYLALFLHDVYIRAANETGPTARPWHCIGRAHDIEESSYLSKAVAFVLKEGLVELRCDGTFRASDAVAGHELLSAIWKLKGIAE